MIKLVKVWPNIIDDKPEDDTLTARFDNHDGTWAGRLVRGSIYKVIEEYTITKDEKPITFYRLEVYKDAFPFVRTPANRAVWVNSSYLKEYTEGEVEPPVVDSDLIKLIYVACKAVVDYIEK